MDAVLFVLFGLAVSATAAENVSAWARGVRLFTWSELWARSTLRGGGVLRGGAPPRNVRGVYSAVHAHAAVSSLPRGAAGLALAFVAYDFAYYVDHRACHRLPLLWASHRVHHETRSFHLLTGLRMSVVGPVLAYGFRLPLAVVGVPPAIYFAVDALHALLTYFTHARFVPDLQARLAVQYACPPPAAPQRGAAPFRQELRRSITPLGLAVRHVRPAGAGARVRGRRD